MRLSKNSDFQKVYKKGKSVANKYLVLYYLKNTLDTPRIGCSVSKKVGNSVVRHRVKRLIKEVYRLNHEPYIKGYDLVFIAKPITKDSSYQDYVKNINHLIKKIEKEVANA